MAVTDTSRNVRTAGGPGGLTRIASAISKWIETRRTRIALSRLSDRELADIGLTRGDIDRVDF
jgi:uncharacterized protein YjiS (DUF1127 family)